MTHFRINSPDIRDVGTDERTGRQLFELRQPLEFTCTLAIGGKLEIVVPAGYVTDYASVPRFLWSIFPPWGTYSRAAIVHDFLCTDRSAGVSRFFADAIFREAMLALGVPWWKRVAMYYAVRWFAVIRDRIVDAKALLRRLARRAE